MRSARRARGGGLCEARARARHQTPGTRPPRPQGATAAASRADRPARRPSARRPARKWSRAVAARESCGEHTTVTGGHVWAGRTRRGLAPRNDVAPRALALHATEEETMMTAAALLIAADLFAAIRAQDLPQVERLLAADPSLAAKVDEKGVSPVSIAMGARRAEGFVPRKENRVLDALLRRSPPLSPFETAGLGTADQVRALAKDPGYLRSVASNGWTPLHYAAFNDNADAAAALLDAGAEGNARAKNKFDNTPLQVSLLTSSRRVARVLLARGADVNARQAEGVTALHEAAQSGDLEIIRMLLAAGADPKAASPKFGTPHDLARKGKHAEAARLLADAEKKP